MDKVSALISIACCCCLVTSEITIKELKVPEEIEHGSKKDVVLDCDFEMESGNDRNGLAIKWFYNDDRHQVYQWIPGTSIPPQALGILKDRLDLAYKATNESNTMYRALKIMNITPELSGEYNCIVSSFFSEASEKKKMIIYEPAKQFDFVHVEQSDTYLCSAYGVFPKPIMNVYASGSNLTKLDDGDNDEDNDVESSEDDDDLVEVSDGLYNLTTSFKYVKSELTEATEFICDLKIPDTNYHKTLRRVYYPDGEPTTSNYDYIDVTNSTEQDNSSTLGNQPCSILLLSFLLLSSSSL